MKVGFAYDASLAKVVPKDLCIKIDLKSISYIHGNKLAGSGPIARFCQLTNYLLTKWPITGLKKRAEGGMLAFNGRG
ncbi:MAG: hypothetical protein JSU80_08915 [Deltaproteobacteria bacterium]|nr:MAG: hypothetical protein JSU80_08915 [Deltaproteobacteria bacterium]